LLELKGETLVRVENLRAPVERLVEAQGSLWVLAHDQVSRLRGDSWQKISDKPMTDLCEHLGETKAALPGQTIGVHQFFDMPYHKVHKP